MGNKVDNPKIFFKKPNNIGQEILRLKDKNPAFWSKKGEKYALDLFSYVAKSVPAYKKFLKTHKVNSKTIKSSVDFKSIPPVTKKNYLRKYKYEELFPNSNFHNSTTLSATSGSTGEPFYFPRAEEHDSEYEYMAEIFLKHQFQIDKKSTLCIMGFALGIWIGGIFTYKVLNNISQKGYKLTIIPTGTNRDQFLKSLKRFGNFYDQVILMGYPPFIKDLVDEAKEYKIRWKDYNLRILTAAEGYSEPFRLHIAKRIGVNPYRDVINMYGTVEQGTLAHETVFANMIRNIAVNNKKVFKQLFPGATSTPTLAQYYPYIVYFEEENGQILATGYGSSIPLIRYKFSDLGGVMTFDRVLDILKDAGVDIAKEMKRYEVKNSDILKLPFVYIYARSDFGIVFRGANIYPNEVRLALDKQNISKYVTGRSSIKRFEDKKMNQKMVVNVELKERTNPTKSIEKKVQDTIITELCKNNSEFRNEYTSHPSKATPKIKLWKFGEKKYFSRTGKQEWIKK